MRKAITVHGNSESPAKSVICSDGIHPGYGGHIDMAAAMLKAVRFVDDMGSIILDYESGKSSQDGPQRIASVRPEKSELVGSHLPLGCLRCYHFFNRIEIDRPQELVEKTIRGIA